LGLPLRRLVLPFAVWFYPLKAAGAITFVWLDTKAAGATGGGFEYLCVGRCEGGVVVVSWSRHRGGPSIVVVGAIAIAVAVVVGAFVVVVLSWWGVTDVSWGLRE